MTTERRLIDANALDFVADEKNCANKVWIMGEGGGKQMSLVLWALKRMIEQAPTIDAVEVVHGYWKEVTDEDEIVGEMDFFQCSVCGKLRWFETNYCPNCGAKMDGDGNG